MRSVERYHPRASKSIEIGGRDFDFHSRYAGANQDRFVALERPVDQDQNIARPKRRNPKGRVA